jgi:hypothetical protein
MRKIFFPCCLFLLLTACGNRKDRPDVSGIRVNVHIERFDKAFFSIDSNRVAEGLDRLNREFPYFANDFVVNILGAGPLNRLNDTTLAATRQFLVSYLPVKDSIESRFERLDWLEKELADGFRHVKYYFPAYRLPQKVVAYIGPFDAPGAAITNYALGIGLQVYAGKDLSFYNSAQGQDMYPVYLSRRFEPPYIAVNSIKAIAEDLFPDQSDNKSLVEQMIEKGKYWWLTDRLLPETPDSLKTGFTQKQLDWCRSNEGLIWNFLLEHTDLYTLDPDLIKNYIGEAPNTQGMPDASPGNIGQWVGWQIVRKYADGMTISPEQLMRTDARKIFEGSKYKPK